MDILCLGQDTGQGNYFDSSLDGMLLLKKTLLGNVLYSMSSIVFLFVVQHAATYKVWGL